MKNTARETRGKLTADRIVSLYRSGLGTRAIAHLHGTSRGSICAILRRRKAELNGSPQRAGKFKKTERIKGKLSATEIVSLYATRRLSALKIAVIDGTSPTIVLRLIKRAGLAIRPANSHVKHGMHQRAKKLGLPVETYLRFRALVALGAKCNQCGIADLRVLQINHLGIKKGPPHYAEFMDIIRNGSKLHDVRCANCNILYEFERGRRRYPANLFSELQASMREPQSALIQAHPVANP